MVRERVVSGVIRKPEKRSDGVVSSKVFRRQGKADEGNIQVVGVNESS
jgi:hypothetical protein